MTQTPAGGQWATISGGQDNAVTGQASAISGGSNNTLSALTGAIAGGQHETLSTTGDTRVGATTFSRDPNQQQRTRGC